MAGNQVGYLINPSNSSSKGITHTTGTTTTVYTASANDKVSSFSITCQSVGTAGTDITTITLKIGTAKFTIMCNSAAGFGTQLTVTSDQLGYKGGFLQAADTITFQTSFGGGAQAGAWSCAIAVDNYTA